MTGSTVDKPSELCERKFEETGCTEYLEMYNIWKARGM